MRMQDKKVAFTKVELIGLLETVREIYPELGDTPITEVQVVDALPTGRPTMRCEFDDKVVYTNCSKENWNAYSSRPCPVTDVVFRYAVKWQTDEAWALFEQPFNLHEVHVGYAQHEADAKDWVDAAPRLTRR
jgi:hypothetical protein